MKPLFLAITFSCSLFATGVLHCEELVAGKQVAASVEVEVENKGKQEKETMHYLVSVPENYESQEKFPLMIFLHGAGERGQDLDQVKKHGPPKIVKESNKTEFIIVSPQCPKGEWWRADKLSKLLDHVLESTKADPDRVYITGLSMGGFGTWSWIAKEPERFAAAIPICGGGDVNAVDKMAKLPIWVFHGEDDKVVAFSSSEKMVRALEKIEGSDVKFTSYPNTGHDSWTKTYENPEVYKWMLNHVRKK